MKFYILSTLIFLFIVDINSQSIVEGELLLKDGDAVDVSLVSIITGMSVNLNGECAVGFRLDNNDDGLWSEGNVLHLNSDFPTLTGMEGTLGFGSDGNFIISPAIDGSDAVFGDDGVIAVEEVQAPGFPMGVITTFHSRPQMFGKDNAYWIAGINSSGGTSSENRVFYTQKNLGTITPIFSSGNLTVDGVVIDNIDFDYDVSDNDLHFLNVLFKDTGSSADDGTLVLNGVTTIAQESSPIDMTENWDNFDFVAINNEGDFIFTGDTDGASDSDEFLALNGNIEFREGDVLDGITLTSPMTFDGISMNNFGKIVFVVSYAGGTETLFETDINDVVGNCKAILSTGDFLDIDNNGVSDFIVDDFNAASFPDLDLSDHNFVYLELDVTPVAGGTSDEALVKIQLDCPGSISLSNLNGDIDHDVPVYAEADVINASNVLGMNSNVGYDANIEINLMPGFETIVGALFEARIDGCGNLGGPIIE